MGGSRIIRAGVPVIVLLAAFFVYNYGFVYVSERLSSIKDEQALALETIRKFKALEGEIPELKKRVSALREARKAAEAKLLGGGTSALSGASLQETVKGIVLSNGGLINSERINKTEEKGGFSVVSVGVEALLPDAEALAKTLYGIETAEPYMTLKELEVRVRNVTAPKELSVRLNVTGLSASK